MHSKVLDLITVIINTVIIKENIGLKLVPIFDQEYQIIVITSHTVPTLFMLINKSAVVTCANQC